MAADPAFADTNVLVYSAQAGRGAVSTPQHEAATAKLAELEAEGVDVWVSRQVLREYLAAVTRPQGSAPPLAMSDALADVRSFVQLFNVADDGPTVTGELLKLLATFPTAGKQVHDANIVATMLAYGIPRLLIFNTADFRRFAGLIRLEPL